jgi:hypothetical protein
MSTVWERNIDRGWQWCQIPIFHSKNLETKSAKPPTSTSCPPVLGSFSLDNLTTVFPLTNPREPRTKQQQSIFSVSSNALPPINQLLLPSVLGFFAQGNPNSHTGTHTPSYTMPFAVVHPIPVNLQTPYSLKENPKNINAFPIHSIVASIILLVKSPTANGVISASPPISAPRSPGGPTNYLTHRTCQKKQLHTQHHTRSAPQRAGQGAPALSQARESVLPLWAGEVL